MRTKHKDLLLRMVAMLTKMVRDTTYMARNADMQSSAHDPSRIVVIGFNHV